MSLFRKAIEGNEDKLVEEIEVEGTALWTKLLAKNVLNAEQIEICKKEV